MSGEAAQAAPGEEWQAGEGGQIGGDAPPAERILNQDEIDSL